MAMDFNLDDLKKLSPKLKALILCLVCLVVGYLYYMLLLEGQLAKRSDLAEKLATLGQQAEEKERLVAQLGRYQREHRAVEAAFQQALTKLPNEREIAGLLASVVQSGKAAGIAFLLFEPKPPEKKPAPGSKEAKTAEAKAAAEAKAKGEKVTEQPKFYEEILVKVQILGPFHATLAFFERVARLPRIVNVEEIAMGEAKSVKGGAMALRTSCTVKTYMFVEQK